MKTKIIIFLAASALTTLSFTFVSVSNTKKADSETSAKQNSSAPIGGFVAEDKI